MVSHYEPPSWAGKPPVGLHLDVAKEEKFLQKLMIDEKKCYLFGRNTEICDFPVEHNSCSRVHAALVYHKNLDIVYLVDLGSTHGTFIGSVRLEANKLTQVPIDANFHFGASTRTYTLREKPQTNDPDEGMNTELPSSEIELDNLTEYNTAHNRRVTVLGISDDPSLNKSRKKGKVKKVEFNKTEDIINPEDIDPTVGKFRNLIQTEVIPMKKQKISQSSNENVSTGSILAGIAAGHQNDPRNQESNDDKSSKDSSSINFKLGMRLPNPAPEILMEPEPAKVAFEFRDPTAKVRGSSFAGASMSPLDALQKKKYPKEAWGGKKNRNASFGVIF